MEDTLKAQGQALTWKQDGAFKQSYHLYAGDKVIAQLQVGGITGMNAQLEAGGRSLTIKRSGFFGNHYQITDVATTAEVARYESSAWSGGVLTFADGRQVAWHKTSFWHNRYVFELEDGTDLLRFASLGIIKLGAEMEIVASLPNDELMLLAGLGMYLLVAANNDGANAGVIAAVS